MKTIIIAKPAVSKNLKPYVLLFAFKLCLFLTVSFDKSAALDITAYDCKKPTHLVAVQLDRLSS